MRTVVCERISMREDRCPQLSVPIDAELKARLEAAAAREGKQSVASLVRKIVIKALDSEREGAAAA
jgi:hypothetical protein